MKIEFESGAKIVGTKRVSAKGQVSGLTEYANSEVMIILIPKEGKAVKPTIEYLYHELHKAAEAQMEFAFKNSKQLNEIFGTPKDAVDQFLEKYTPESVLKLKENMDDWLKNFMPEFVKGQIEDIVNNQMKEAFKRYETLRDTFSSPEEATREFINKYAPKNAQKIISDVESWIEMAAPKTVRDQVQAAAEEHIKLAFKHYDKLQKEFGTPNEAATEFMDKYAPENVNKFLEDMQTWLDNFKPKDKKKK